MAKKKGKRQIVVLESTAGTGHQYWTEKNVQNTPDKMTLKKYDPVAREHVDYKEGKVK